MQLHELVVMLKALAVELGKTPTVKEFMASGASRRQIDKYKHSTIVRAAGLEPNAHSQTTDPIELVLRPPRILILDIEVSPMKVYVYKLWGDQSISPKQMVDDWYLLSYAAKFLDDDTIYYLDSRYESDVRNDRLVVEGLCHLIEQSDCLIGHNLDRFDIKKLKTRALKYDLPPLRPVQTIDTLKICKKLFAISSNSLSYVAKFLGCDNSKSEHNKFSGFDLWTECMNGNKEAWIECEDYNKKDVIVTEEVYRKLIPHDPSINFQAHTQKTICTCGNGTFFRDGFRYTKQGRFQVMRCKKCSKTYTAKENLIDKDVRKNFFK